MPEQAYLSVIGRARTGRRVRSDQPFSGMIRPCAKRAPGRITWIDAVPSLDAKLVASASASRRPPAVLAELRRVALELRGSETALSMVRFLLVGLVGLASDATTYSVCAAWDFGDAIARAVSLGLATCVTWRLNRAFTFGASRRSPAAEGTRYALVALGAQGANYLIFLGLRAAAPQLPALLCILLSAACAATFSFLGQRFYTFGRASPRFGSREPAAHAASDRPLSPDRRNHGSPSGCPTPESVMSTHTETLVIGAGPAGLTAGYMLSKQGRDVTVLERDPAQVGGISRTVSHNGFLFDIGGHRFFSKSKEVVELWDEILPNDFIERPRLSRIYYKGKFYSYPLKATEALLNPGLVESTACVLSYLRARAFPIAEPRSFHDWVRNQFGERLFSIFFKTYTEKVWGMSCDAISADWAAQRIKGLSLAEAIRNAVVKELLPNRAGRSARDGEVIKTLIESFRYPRR